MNVFMSDSRLFVRLPAVWKPTRNKTLFRRAGLSASFACNLERNPKRHSPLHQFRQIRIEPFPERIPTAERHLRPSRFGQCQSARISHIVGTVYVFDGLSPKCSHHTRYMLSLSRLKLISRVELIR